MFKKNDLNQLLGIGSIRAAKVETTSVEAAVGAASESIADVVVNATVEEVFSTETVGLDEDLSDPSAVSDEVASVPTRSIETEMIQLLSRQIEQLEKQLDAKDQQLASKDDIIKNFQVLLKCEQDAVLQLTTIKKSKRAWYQWWQTDTEHE